MFDLYNTHLWYWEFTLQCAPFDLLFYPTMRTFDIAVLPYNAHVK